MRCYAALFHDYLEEMDALSDEEFGRLCRALLRYSIDGTEVDLPGNEKYFIKRVINQEERSINAYRSMVSAKSEAGKKGMQRRWHNSDNSVISVITDVTDDNKNNKEKEEEEEKEKEKVLYNNTDGCPFEKIKKLYHEICVSFPAIRTIDGNRRIAVSARWRSYKSIDTFRELFTIAENSDFLKGTNGRNWHADFDWMMKPTNFSKILEHKYDGKARENPPGDSFDTDEFFADALKKSYGG